MAHSKTAERPARQPPFAAPHVFILAVTDGHDAHAVHRLTQPETAIGRAPEADLRIEDEAVSNRHCLIRVDGAVCTLVDLGSRNGTWVNARPVVRQRTERLRHLDVIQLGDTQIMLLCGRFPEQLDRD